MCPRRRFSGAHPRLVRKSEENADSMATWAFRTGRTELTRTYCLFMMQEYKGHRKRNPHALRCSFEHWKKQKNTWVRWKPVWYWVKTIEGGRLVLFLENAGECLPLVGACCNDTWWKVSSWGSCRTNASGAESGGRRLENCTFGTKTVWRSVMYLYGTH